MESFTHNVASSSEKAVSSELGEKYAEIWVHNPQ